MARDEHPQGCCREHEEDAKERALDTGEGEADAEDGDDSHANVLAAEHLDGSHPTRVHIFIAQLGAQKDAGYGAVDQGW